MNKLNEMWAAVAAYQPKADAEGHGDTWAAMCREKTSDAAEAAAWSAADAAWSAADAADAAAWSAADAAWSAADAADAAKAAGDTADRWAQSAIDGINKLKE